MKSVIMVIISSIVLIRVILMYRRIGQVGNYRMKLIDAIAEANEHDIKNKRFYGWRYQMFYVVTHEMMYNQWWRPIESFWFDKSFAEIDGLPPINFVKEDE